MLTEGWRSGPLSVDFQYGSSEASESHPVTVDISEGWQAMTLHLTTEEFKSLLKAGLRLDENLPRPSVWIATLPEDKPTAPRSHKGGPTMKKKVTALVCDGCGADITEGETGSAKARVEVVGEDFIRNIDFCPECVSGQRVTLDAEGNPVIGEDGEPETTELHSGLPLGTTRKRRVENGEATPAATEAPALADMTVPQLDEKYGQVEGYPASGNKAEKLAFAEAQ